MFILGTLHGEAWRQPSPTPGAGGEPGDPGPGGWVWAVYTDDSPTEFVEAAGGWFRIQKVSVRSSLPPGTSTAPS